MRRGLLGRCMGASRKRGEEGVGCVVFFMAGLG